MTENEEADNLILNISGGLQFSDLSDREKGLLAKYYPDFLKDMIDYYNSQLTEAQAELIITEEYIKFLKEQEENE